MTEEKRPMTIDEIIDHPEEWFREILPEVRRENPHLTEDQIRWMWQQTKFQFGL